MKVVNDQANFTKCVCPHCPSYDECMKQKNEALFCARAKSTCDFKRKGCICMSCPVSQEYELTGGYYCGQ